MVALVLKRKKASVIMNTQSRIAPKLVAIGSFLSVIAVSVIGLNEWRAARQCTAAWDHAGERAGDHLTDRSATPYLGMMMASKHEVPASYRVGRSDFVSACRAGAVWQVVLRDEAGVYQVPTRIMAVQATTHR